MQTILDYLNDPKWLLLTTVSTGVIGVVAFAKTLLDSHRQALEIRRLKKQLAEDQVSIVLPTLDEVQRYGRKKMSGSSIGTLMLLLACTLGFLVISNSSGRISDVGGN